MSASETTPTMFATATRHSPQLASSTRDDPATASAASSAPSSQLHHQQQQPQQQQQHQQQDAGNSSLAALLTMRSNVPSTSHFAVIKLSNITWNLSIMDVVAYFGDLAVPIGHVAPYYTQAVHIIMNRATGKTQSDCFVEFPTFEQAQHALDLYSRGILKGRVITAQHSSQDELMEALFPYRYGSGYATAVGPTSATPTPPQPQESLLDVTATATQSRRASLCATQPGGGSGGGAPMQDDQDLTSLGFPMLSVPGGLQSDLRTADTAMMMPQQQQQQQQISPLRTTTFTKPRFGAVVEDFDPDQTNTGSNGSRIAYSSTSGSNPGSIPTSEVAVTSRSGGALGSSEANYPSGSGLVFGGAMDATHRQPKQGVFLTRDEINAILLVCRNYKLHFSRKCAERPFENIISIMSKIPWTNVSEMTTFHRDHLFELLKLGLESLRSHLNRLDHNIDPTLLERMTRAGLCVPLFTERQKLTLLSVANMDCPPDLVEFVYNVDEDTRENQGNAQYSSDTTAESKSGVTDDELLRRSLREQNIGAMASGTTTVDADNQAIFSAVQGNSQSTGNAVSRQYPGRFRSNSTSTNNLSKLGSSTFTPFENTDTSSNIGNKQGPNFRGPQQFNQGNYPQQQVRSSEQPYLVNKQQGSTTGQGPSGEQDYLQRKVQLLELSLENVNQIYNGLQKRYASSQQQLVGLQTKLKSSESTSATLRKFKDEAEAKTLILQTAVLDLLRIIKCYHNIVSSDPIFGLNAGQMVASQVNDSTFTPSESDVGWITSQFGLSGIVSDLLSESVARKVVSAQAFANPAVAAQAYMVPHPVDTTHFTHSRRPSGASSFSGFGSIDVNSDESSRAAAVAANMSYYDPYMVSDQFGASTTINSQYDPQNASVAEAFNLSNYYGSSPVASQMQSTSATTPSGVVEPQTPVSAGGIDSQSARGYGGYAHPFSGSVQSPRSSEYGQTSVKSNRMYNIPESVAQQYPLSPASQSGFADFSQDLSFNSQPSNILNSGSTSNSTGGGSSFSGLSKPSRTPVKITKPAALSPQQQQQPPPPPLPPQVQNASLETPLSGIGSSLNEGSISNLESSGGNKLVSSKPEIPAASQNWGSSSSNDVNVTPIGKVPGKTGQKTAEEDFCRSFLQASKGGQHQHNPLKIQTTTPFSGLIVDDQVSVKSPLTASTISSDMHGSDVRGSSPQNSKSPLSPKGNGKGILTAVDTNVVQPRSAAEASNESTELKVDQLRRKSLPKSPWAQNLMVASIMRTDSNSQSIHSMTENEIDDGVRNGEN